jgi:hypothetical protein
MPSRSLFWHDSAGRHYGTMENSGCRLIVQGVAYRIVIIVFWIARWTMVNVVEVQGEPDEHSLCGDLTW